MPNKQLPIVVMAGGRGIRMGYMSDVIPKPLIPVNGQAMIETVINKFRIQGYTKFNIIVNYMGELIQAYLTRMTVDLDIEFTIEKKYLGTAGALKLLDIKDDFFCTNCDIWVDEPYQKIYEFHKNAEADMTIVTTNKEFYIPYGVFQCDATGKVVAITEKPKLLNTVNVGFYLINPNILNILNGGYMEMDELIERALTEGYKIFLYNILPKNFIDIGTLETYKKYIKELANV